MPKKNQTKAKPAATPEPTPEPAAEQVDPRRGTTEPEPTHVPPKGSYVNHTNTVLMADVGGDTVAVYPFRLRKRLADGKAWFVKAKRKPHPNMTKV
jgi:hypothetical protein